MTIRNVLDKDIKADAVIDLASLIYFLSFTSSLFFPHANSYNQIHTTMQASFATWATFVRRTSTQTFGGATASGFVT